MENDECPDNSQEAEIKQSRQTSSGCKTVSLIINFISFRREMSRAKYPTKHKKRNTT
jgi:hypothetical protein